MRNANGNNGNHGNFGNHGQAPLQARQQYADAQYGNARHDGKLANPALLEDVVLSDAAAASLRFMIEEEKLAGDLYETFADQTGLQVFDRIASAEDRHLSALIKLAESAGVDVADLLALPAGTFAAAELQTLYDGLLASGSVSADAALAVGREVELADIADLDTALTEFVEPALVGIYGRLLNGSEHHLTAFDNALAA